MKSLRLSSIGFVLLTTFLLTTGAVCSKTKADGGVFLSIDAANTWTPKSYVGQQNKKVVTISGVDIATIEFDPTNAATAYVGTKTNGIYKTTTSGDQWSPLIVKSGHVRDIAVDPKHPEVLYAVTGSSILKSSSSGDQWEAVYTDAQQAQTMTVLVDWYNTNRLFATTSIGTVLLSEDAGETWNVKYQVNEPVTAVLMSTVDSRVVYILELDNAIHKTLDGGITWENLFEKEAYKEFQKENRDFKVSKVRSISMDPKNPLTILTVTNSGILKTADGGNSWSILPTLLPADAQQNSSIRNVTIHPTESNIIYFTVGRLIHKTVNAGTTWKTIENFPSSRVISVLTVPTAQPDLLYAAVETPVEKKEGFNPFGL